jgi:3'-phosphoadenosine 5'-phosphosulfate sulfotransferase (PAPS reductase)/FAD synthetase
MGSNEKHVALCSGGRDSVAATHYAMNNTPADEVVFLHTRTDPPDAYSAIDATIDWLRDWCDENGWPFRVVETDEDFDDWVEEKGYPGPPLHWIAYNKLKDRPIDKLRKQVDGELHCWTGIRKHESNQRAEFDAEDDERGDGRWYWHRPLIDYTDEEVDEYLNEHGLEPADVVQELGRSADCWCGAFGDRTELLELEAVGFEEHAEWLRNLSPPDDAPREQQNWAGYNWEKSDWAKEDRRQMTLCSSCDRNKEVDDGE